MKSYPLIVIGAGAGGLVVAIGAAKAGKKVLLVEKGPYGGDCTNFGCIPSKSLIAAAHVAHSLKTSRELGIECASLEFTAKEALTRTRQIIREVRSQEEPPALEKLGIDTLTGTATFIDPHVLEVNGEKIFGKQIVIATGSSPLIPSIPGLEKTSFLTSENIFDLEEIPRTLCVIGGGPIGCELAQAFQRLGAQVTMIHKHEKLLDKEEPIVQDAIIATFKKEGITLHLGAKIEEVHQQNRHFQITLQDGTKIETQQLLLAVGRKVNLEALNLQAAGVEFTDKGIRIDEFGRTSQEHIWAVGDIVGAPFFTHRAENQGRAVLTSLLLPFKKKIDPQPIPRVTFTDPEVASIGLSEEEAVKKYTIASYLVPFNTVDRAITTGRTEGFVKVITKKWSSRILGCTIVAPCAGEMLGEISLAMLAKIPLRKLARLIHPYPTYNLALRKAADLWLTQTLLSLFRRKAQ